MVHILKIFYKVQNNEMQIRRLAVNSEVVSRFDLLTKKIKEMYPVLTQRNFDVKWKDPENDMIYMSSDEELAQALANAEDGMLKVYVYSSDLKDVNGTDETEVKVTSHESHLNVICDGCDKNIHGHRYKCLQCRNYDLCATCNAANKHDCHDMIKLVRPVHVSREWVFIGSRKLWRSMFGRFCFKDWRSQREEPAASNSPTDESPKEKNTWHSVVDNLLKGDYVPVEKLMKENLGNFLNFVDSSFAGADVRIENCPFKRGPCPNTNDKKSDECASEKSTENVKQNVALKDEPLQAQSSNDKEKVEAADMKKDTSNAQDPLVYITDMMTQMHKTFSKPAGLFSDLDSSINAEGWTVLTGEEVAKKDAATPQETGAKPKTLYPPVPKVKELEKQQPESTASVAQNPQEAAAGVAQNPQEPAAGVAQNPQEPAAGVAYNPQEPAVTSPICQNPEIMNALYKMQAMGFTNEGGWLERLLITKDGNINAALDALYPNTRRH